MLQVYGELCSISNGTLPTAGTSSLYYHNPEESTLTAISLKAGEEGRVLWTKNYQMTFNDGTQNTLHPRRRRRICNAKNANLSWKSLTFTQETNSGKANHKQTLTHSATTAGSVS